MAPLERREVAKKTKMKPLPKFPVSTFDCTVVASTDTPVANILASLKKVKIKELQSTKVIDIYGPEGENKAVTLRSTLFDPEKTLKGEFITECSNKIVETLAKNGFPLKS